MTIMSIKAIRFKRNIIQNQQNEKSFDLIEFFASLKDKCDVIWYGW